MASEYINPFRASHDDDDSTGAGSIRMDDDVNEDSDVDGSGDFEEVDDEEESDGGE